MNEAVVILKRERDVAIETIRELKARLKHLDSAITLLETQPSPVKAPRSEGGDLREMVLKVVAGSGLTGIKPSDIASKLTTLGRATSEASVSSTLSRLKAGAKVRNQHGSWFAVSETASGEISPEAEIELEPGFNGEEIAPPFRRSGSDNVRSNPEWDYDPDIPF